MRPEDVARILEASAKSGVRVLKFAGLEVEFGGLVPQEPLDMPSPRASAPAAAMAEPNHTEQARASLEMEELRLREQQLDELLITDPEEAERMIASGELEADGSDAEELD